MQIRDIKDKIRYACLWLRRFGDSRGFGVQSPTAYSFIRYVINEHYPYYAYSDLKIKYPDLTWMEYKLLELYFRISNFKQAGQWVCDTKGKYGDGVIVADYIRSACSATDVVNSLYVNNKPDVILLSCLSEILNDIDRIFNYTHSSTMIIIEDIHSSDKAKGIWKEVIADDRTGRTYDLYYCGIVFMDKEKFKQHYVVNF